MSRIRRLLTALRSAVTIGSGASVIAARTPPAPAPVDSPGHGGPDATIELDPSGLGGLGWGYAPENDGALDRGEIVWTWVPYQERDGRGKDRPVVIMATMGAGDLLAVQLTSTDHSGDNDYVPLGVGGWDRVGRPSWAGIGRVFRVRQGGVRREGTVVGAARYSQIERALRARHHWR